MSRLAVHILIADDLPLLDFGPILGLFEGFEGLGQRDRLAARFPAHAGSKLVGAALVNGRHFRLWNRKPGGRTGPPLAHYRGPTWSNNSSYFRDCGTKSRRNVGAGEGNQTIVVSLGKVIKTKYGRWRTLTE
jgi:hypothetical protein